MVQFKFKGVPKPSYIKTMGPILGFRFKKKDGTVEEIRAPDQTKGYLINDVIDIPDDERVKRTMKGNPHFEEVVGPILPPSRRPR